MNISIQKSSPKAGKVIELDIVDNFKKAITCPKCKYDLFEGFSTGYGPYRRCLNNQCRYEWPCGGLSSLVMASQQEKEDLRQFHNNITQDDVLNKALSLADDIERLEDVKDNERLSGSSVNRALWNDYLRNWLEEGEDY